MGNTGVESNRKVLLPAEAGVLVEEDVYFFSSRYNLLYKVHIPDFAVSIISHISCEKILAFEWFRKMQYWNGKLIFIPSYAEKIWMYDLNSEEWNDINIDYPEIKLKFFGSVIYQNNIFLMGLRYPAILKVNLNDCSTSYIKVNDWSGNKMSTEGLFFTNAVRVGNMMYSPVSVSNYVLQFNLDTSEYVWQQIGGIDNKYSGIDYDGSNFWISSGLNGRIVRWDGNLKWEEYEVPEEIANRSYQFIGVICDGNKIRFLTQQDGRSFEIVHDAVRKDHSSLTKVTRRYIHLEHYENGTIILMQRDACLEIKQDGKWIKGKCEIDYEELKAYFCENFLWDTLFENGIGSEVEIFGVNDYVEIIAKQQHKTNSFLNNDGTNIWNIVKG